MNPNQTPASEFLVKVQMAIIDPIITLLAVGAFVVFVWGVVEFIANAGDSEKRKQGQRHIIWGLVGLTILFGAQAIVGLIAGTVGGFN